MSLFGEKDKKYEENQGNSISTNIELKKSNLPEKFDEDLRAMFSPSENLEGIENIKLPRIKIVKETQMFLDEVNDETTKELFCIPLAKQRSNALWIKDDHPLKNQNVLGTKMPDCYSLDSKKASCDLYSETATCISCRYNEYKSIELIDKPGKGKACKNFIVFALLRIEKNFNDESIKSALLSTPKQISAPPTSINNINEYSQKCTFGKNSVHTALTVARLTLDKKTEPHLHSVIKIEFVDSLINFFKDNTALLKKHYELTKQIHDLILRTPLTTDDYDTSEEGEAF